MYRSNRPAALAAVLLLAHAAPAFAQNPPVPPIHQEQDQSAAGGRLTEAQKQKLLDDQRDAFIYHVEKERAEALKAWCETGMAPLNLCRPADAAAQAAPAAPVAQAAPAAAPAADKKPEKTEKAEPTLPIEARELPLVAGLTGFADNLTATVQYTNGNRLTVVAPHGTKPGSRLPNGDVVVSITPKTTQTPPMVMVAKPGDEANAKPLLFAPISSEAR